MKYLLIIFACFAVLSCVSCDNSQELLDKVKSKRLKAYLKDHEDKLESGSTKLEEICPGVTDKLKKAVISLEQCDDNIDDSLTVCEAVHTATLNCTAPLIKVVDDCLPQNAKGVPELAVKIVVSVIDFLCKQTGESIFELLNPCILEGLDEDTGNSCVSPLVRKAEAHKKKNSLPSKSEVCGALTGLTSCVQLSSTLTCKNSKTKAALLGFNEAVTAPCRGGILSGLTSLKPTLAIPKPGNPLNSIF